VDAVAEVVVVGGGSAGCVVAGRLCERGHDVVLVEAGPDYGPFGDARWPTELLDARIAPLFRDALERMRVRTYGHHEAGPFHALCLEAAEGLGWRMADDLCDLDANDSFGLESVNVVGTVRWNAAFAYLDPVRSSGFLRIVDEVLVDRVMSSASGAVVHGVRHGEPWQAEGAVVVLAAGVYGTPAILQRSGVGPTEVLQAAGIDVLVPSDGVGADLHDHPMVHADRAVGEELQRWLDAAAATGFLPEEQTLGKALSGRSDGLFDLHVFPVCASDQTSLLHGRVHVEVACMTPRSRGRVAVTDPDPASAPLIDHAYLSDPERHDLAVLRDGLVLAEELLDHPVLARVLGARLTDMSNDEAIRSTVAHYYHPVGTCRMGVDDAAPCDTDGSVRGLPGVVVADASLMPRIPRANTNLPAVMLGEGIARRLAERF
jgi:choline dehydrogenase